MNNLKNYHRQHTMNDGRDDLSVSILGDVTALCREADRSRPADATGQARRDDIFAELDAIEVPAIITSFVATCETPENVLAILPPEMVSALADVQHSESLGIRAARQRKASPEAVALHEANKAHGHTAQAQDRIDAYRKGDGREDYNASRRASYSAEIGRVARAYSHHGEDDASRQRSIQNSNRSASQKRRDNMTLDEKRAEAEKASQRRRERKARLAAEAATQIELQRQAYIDASIA
jgi:hypothetical protein